MAIFQGKCDQTLKIVVTESVQTALHLCFIHPFHVPEGTNSMF